MIKSSKTYTKLYRWFYIILNLIYSIGQDYVYEIEPYT